VILITGANGNLGRRLLRALCGRDEPVRAVVRSGRAAQQIADVEEHPAVEVVQLDYLDEAAMFRAMQGARVVIHLIGIIKQTAQSRYADAHEGTTRVIADCAERAGVERLIYLSIVGTSVDSPNACLASKAKGERILRDCRVPALILRVPMVLGEGDYASRALRSRAEKAINILLRGSSLEQPIYAGDVEAAILAAAKRPIPLAQDMDLAGPRSLTRRELTHAAAAVLAKRTRVISLPLALGMLAAWLFELISANPPVSRDMLGVLDHDDDLDAGSAAAELGIELTPLEEMLQLCLQRS